MNMELLQGMIDIVFKGNLLFLSPILLIIMVTIFSERLIELVGAAVSSTSNRRTRY